MRTRDPRWLTALGGAGVAVRFTRPFEKAVVRGFVDAATPRLLLVQILTDGARTDGWQCVRMRDVRGIGPDPYAGFVRRAMHARRVRRRRAPRVRIDSFGSLLESANRLFPLVTVHEERVHPRVCWIGRVAAVDGSHVSLLAIDPDARWDATVTRHALTRITRVDFGGEYEEALHLVGGPPPRTRHRAARR
jgi:hypothetical protein